MSRQDLGAHQLYQTGDRDVPEQLLDQNGEVVLGMCRVCRQAEGDLEPECPGAGAGAKPRCEVCQDEAELCSPEVCPRRVETGSLAQPEPANDVENWQEAQSIRYVCGLRLALLSSGDWAIWQGGEQGFGQLHLVRELDLDRLRSWAEQDREAREHAPAPVVTVEVSKSAAELDL